MVRVNLSLSGDWTGVFDYANVPADPVPFNASLFDVGGVIWGTTTEPNSFGPGQRGDLAADISGARSGSEVSFRKTYAMASAFAKDPIDYIGHVSADGNKIEGTWSIRNPYGTATGPFVMNRDNGIRTSARAKVAAMADIDV